MDKRTMKDGLVDDIMKFGGSYQIRKEQSCSL